MITCIIINVILIFMNPNIKENFALKRNVARVGFSMEGYKQLAKYTDLT